MQRFLSDYRLTVVVAVFLLVAAGLFFNAFYRTRALQQKAQALSAQVGFLQQQEKQVVKGRDRLLLLRDFHAGAAAAGLQPEEWSLYDVQIQRTATFEQLEQILNQCAHGPQYYFKPQALKIQRIPPDGSTQKLAGDYPQQMLAADALQQKDILLSLKGAFVVKGASLMPNRK